MTFRSGYNDAWETPGWTAQNMAYPPPDQNVLFYPNDIDLVTITGHFRASDGGQANGWFDIDNGVTVLRHASTKEFLDPVKTRVEIKDGTFSVTVPATDASTVTCAEGPWSYHVRVSLGGRLFEELHSVFLPATSPNVDVFDLTGDPGDFLPGTQDGPTTVVDGGTP